MRHTVVASCVVAFALALLFGSGVAAQTPAPSQTMSASATLVAKIIAIDQSNRVITLQDSKGNTQSIQVGPSVKRFNELKVGQTVTFVYSESVATSIAKPGTMAPSAAASPTVTRFTGENPGGQISQTVTTTVTIKAIDLNAPSITIVTQDGKTLSLLVQDKTKLAGLKPGDVVQITYTQTLTITVN